MEEGWLDRHLAGRMLVWAIGKLPDPAFFWVCNKLDLIAHWWFEIDWEGDGNNTNYPGS